MSCKRHVFKMVLLLLATLSPWAARAGNCAYQAGQTISPTSIVNLTGSITVGRDVPIGTEIYRASFHGNPTQVTITCGPGNYSSQWAFISLPYPKSTYVDGRFGNNVYETGVPGVGVVAWVGGSRVPFGVPFGSPSAVINFTLPRWFDYSLIKIGDVSPGTIRSSNLPAWDNRAGDNRFLVQSARFSGALNIVAQTCATPNVTKALGNFRLDALTGVGTTTPTVQVDVALNSCPAFYGWNRNDINNEPSAPGLSVSNPNVINFQIDPTGPVLNASQGVVALAPGGATGMGVQILDGNGNPIAFGRKLPSNLVLNTASGGNYTIRLGARYYQVNATTTPGVANASVTMTLEYL